MPKSLGHRRITWIAAVLVVVSVGCGGQATRFERDELLHAASGLTEQQSAAIDSLLEDWFGSPDEPRLPDAAPELANFLDLDHLAQAAGPVISHEPGVTQGLYRRHCARCHGVTGNGRGPTALYQAPYPRDFRLGVFKWKSTDRSAPPTDADLHRVLERGVAGTAMPSFALLSVDERDKLRQYVQYLAIRGQTERALVRFTGDELAPGAPIDIEDEELLGDVVADTVRLIADGWLTSAERVLPVDKVAVEGQPTDEFVQTGERLFHSERAGCAKCHGEQGRGVARGQLADDAVGWDDWTKPRSPEALATAPAAAESIAAADLPPRLAIPRALAGRLTAIGTSPSDLFQRVHEGIAGTPMPAVGGPGGLSDEEVAAVAAYVGTLVASDDRDDAAAITEASR